MQKWPLFLSFPFHPLPSMREVLASSREREAGMEGGCAKRGARMDGGADNKSDLAGRRQRVRQIVAEVAKIGASPSAHSLQKITIRKRTASSVFVRLKGNKSRPNDSVGRATASRRLGRICHGRAKKRRRSPGGPDGLGTNQATRIRLRECTGRWLRNLTQFGYEAPHYKR